MTRQPPPYLERAHTSHSYASLGNEQEGIEIKGKGSGKKHKARQAVTPLQEAGKATLADSRPRPSRTGLRRGSSDASVTLRDAASRGRSYGQRALTHGD